MFSNYVWLHIFSYGCLVKLYVTTLSELIRTKIRTVKFNVHEPVNGTGKLLRTNFFHVLLKFYENLVI